MEFSMRIRKILAIGLSAVLFTTAGCSVHAGEQMSNAPASATASGSSSGISGTVSSSASGMDGSPSVQSSTDQWAEKARMSISRYDFGMETVNGKIYAIGGVNDQVNALPSVEEYDPATDQWTSKKAMNSARSWFQAAVINGKIIVMGGGKKTGDYSRGNFLSSVEEYNPATDAWMEKAPLLTPRGCFRSVMTDGRLYVLGGADGSSNNKGNEPGLASLESCRSQSGDRHQN